MTNRGDRFAAASRRDGHDLVLPLVGDRKDQIMEIVRAHELAGVTCEDVFEELKPKIEDLTLQYVRSRMTELKNEDGLLKVIGRRLNRKETVRISVFTVNRS